MTTIIRIFETSTFNLTGEAVALMHVTFKIDNHGPFEIIIPSKEFTNARAQAEIEKRVREITALTGAKL